MHSYLTLSSSSRNPDKYSCSSRREEKRREEMSLLHHSSPFAMLEKSVASMARVKSSRIDSNVVSLFKPIRDQPILRDAIKEPLAFVGGMIAGFMKLDNEDPLKEWIAKTVEASGMLDSDVDGGAGSADGSTGGGANGAGKQIKIE